MSHYQITEEDINAVMRYFESTHPDRANREYSISFLEYVQSGIQDSLHKLARDPDKFEEFVSQFENSKKNDVIKEF